jgi:hypothetical protein
MKYEIRRAIVSIVLSPIVASIYVFGYALLVGLGAEPTTDISGAWANGYLIALVSGIAFTFWDKIKNLLDRI